MHLSMTASVPDEIHLSSLTLSRSCCLSFHGSLGHIKTSLSKTLSHELLYLQSLQTPGFISWDCYVLFSAELADIVSLKALQVLLKRWCFEIKLRRTFRICWFCPPSFLSFITIISRSHLLLLLRTEVGPTVATSN